MINWLRAFVSPHFIGAALLLALTLPPSVAVAEVTSAETPRLMLWITEPIKAINAARRIVGGPDIPLSCSV